jgi:hypothetical protein
MNLRFGCPVGMVIVMEASLHPAVTRMWFASCADSENTGVVIGFDESG